MKQHITSKQIQNANAYFITDGECSEKHEQIKIICQDLHYQFKAANVSLKVSALGIGDDVKTQCLQEIIKIGSQRGINEIFAQNVTLRDDQVQKIISQSTSQVVNFKQLRLKYGPNNYQIDINLTSQDEKNFMFRASKVVKNFQNYKPFNEDQWKRNFSDKVKVSFEPYIPPPVSNGPPGTAPSVIQSQDQNYIISVLNSKEGIETLDTTLKIEDIKLQLADIPDLLADFRTSGKTFETIDIP